MSNTQVKQKRTRHPKETFSDEDHRRVERLREEIVACATEISLITARTLDIAPPADIREFTLSDGPKGEVLSMSVFKTTDRDSSGASVEIITWGCVCHSQQICCADPNCPPCP